MKYRFSVLMPVYNRKEYVRQAIDSVLTQTFTDFELIAIDDGSTDGAADVLKSYGNRIKFIQQKNQGAEVARNNGNKIAEGEYLVVFDSDDFFFPFALEMFDRIIRYFDSPPVITGATKYFRDGQTLPPALFEPSTVEVLKFPDYISKDISLSTNSIVIKKSVYDEVGGYRNSTPKTWHNDDMYLLLKAGTYSPCIVIQKPATSAYRIHGGNSVGNVNAISNGMLRLAALEREGQFPGGPERRGDRYAVIGGRASTWAIRYNWRNGQRKEALRLLFGTAPMIMTAAWRRVLRAFRKPHKPIVVPDEVPTDSSKSAVNEMSLSS